jgi:hypothetical protein
MSNSLKKWLKTHLEALVNVQRCTFNGSAALVARLYEPDVIVYLWTGARVHIYILNEPVKVRVIKSLLQTDSALGIGSLFIVHAALVPTPENKETFKPEEWLLAIHTLTNQRVYVYSPEREGLTQVHFEKVGPAENYRAVYGPPVVIRQLRYARETIKLNIVKGFWMLADFGTDAFWKRQAQDGSYYEAPAYQRHARQMPPRPHQYTSNQHRNHTNSTHSSTEVPQPAKTRLEQSYELLGLPDGATRDEVKSAFRKLAFQLHPDVSQLEKEEAEIRFKALTEAYEYIKSTNKW